MIAPKRNIMKSKRGFCEDAIIYLPRPLSDENGFGGLEKFGCIQLFHYVVVARKGVEGGAVAVFERPSSSGLENESI